VIEQLWFNAFGPPGYGSFLEVVNQIRARLEIQSPHLVFSRDAFLLIAL